MDTKFQTSFIPKRPIVASNEGPIKTKHPLNFISLVCTIVFVVAVLGAGGMFAYEHYLDGKIASMDGQLAAAKSSIQSDIINQFIRLDTRLNVANQLLRNHVATSVLFSMLQNQTVKTVQFKDLAYTSNGDAINVVLHGQAGSYNAMALQSAIFSQDKFIHSPTFSEMNLDSSGNVLFTLNASVDKDYLAQRNNLDQLTANNF
ncbi:MAG TPA: hypothetical protein VHF05_02675 [Candidatus Paceibacterota bacterium]|jgi:Tfp pilus assembly protein PilN|nr:hypothetical protein [Candidatus Paceibacterota bacterium]